MEVIGGGPNHLVSDDGWWHTDWIDERRWTDEVEKRGEETRGLMKDMCVLPLCGDAPFVVETPPLTGDDDIRRQNTEETKKGVELMRRSVERKCEEREEMKMRRQYFDNLIDYMLYFQD